MPIFFDENELTDEQRSRYNWAVVEYARIQEENRLRREQAGQAPVLHQISGKSALFARLLEGKQPLPFPPPTSYAYPWYDIIERPGRYHVSIGGKLSLAGIANLGDVAGSTEHIVLNQCPWGILRKNDSAATCFAFLQQDTNPLAASAADIRRLKAALSDQPEFIVSYGSWGEFRLSLGRVIRRGRRAAVLGSDVDLHTLDGGNPVIVKVLHPGADIHARSEATLAMMRTRLTQPNPHLSALESITLATENAIPRSANPEEDDLVEYDCDGWILERMQAL